MIPDSKKTVIPIHEAGLILLPIIYFDIFSYPLTFDEIYEFSPNTPLTKDRLKLLIETLVDANYLYQYGHYYSISTNSDFIIQREENTRRALHIMPMARRMTKIISWFPFVRAVLISGSLSKNVIAPDGDIDYFIITGRGRLWVTRTLLVLFKKIFLLNSHKYFCINYFIDDTHLEIEEKNIYTATEIATLLPLYGMRPYLEFYAANQWISNFYPNVSPRSPLPLMSPDVNRVKLFFEYLLKGKLGDYLNKKLMEITLRYWHRKFKAYDPASFENAFKSTSGISKHHPLNFQAKVLEAYKARIRIFEQNHKVTLDAKF